MRLIVWLVITIPLAAGAIYGYELYLLEPLKTIAADFTRQYLGSVDSSNGSLPLIARVADFLIMGATYYAKAFVALFTAVIITGWFRRKLVSENNYEVGDGQLYPA